MLRSGRKGRSQGAGMASTPALISQISVLYGHRRGQEQRGQAICQKSLLTLLLPPLTPAHLISRKIIGGTAQETSHWRSYGETSAYQSCTGKGYSQ